MDEIFEMIDEERIPGTSGNATATKESSRIITEFTSGTLNKYNAFSNFSSVALDTQVADAISGFLTVALERDMNKKFHNDLTILEKNGLITQEKFEMHKRQVETAKQMTTIGVYAAFSLAPVVVTTIKNYLNRNEITDFIIGVYAYINQEPTQLIIHDISNLLLQMNISFSEEKIETIFKKCIQNGSLSQVPYFTKRNRSIFGNDGMDVLAKEIVSRCDLHDDNVRNRAMEFINDFLHIDKSMAQKLVADANCSQEALSDITWFSAINYKYVFLDFIQNVENAQKFAKYDINNDPYSRIREERKSKMQAIVEETAAAKNLFLSVGRRKDIIDASAKMMQYSLNPSYDIKTDIKMLKRERRILELYGLQK